MNVFSLSWAAAGLALLGLSLFPAGSLALGGAPAHLAVFLLLLALAALALRLLRREGLDRPRAAGRPAAHRAGLLPPLPAAGLPVRRLPDVPLPMGRGLPGWGRLRGREAANRQL